MTWPTVAVNTTNVDATTDSPATARADFLDLIQKVNQMISVQPAGRLLNVQVFSSGSGTYTPTAGTTAIIVEAIGGGGGSGGCAAAATGNIALTGNGGCGAYVMAYSSGGIVPQPYSVGVGGSAGSSGGAGGNGGDTTFSSLITAHGGVGSSASAGSPPPFSIGSAASGFAVVSGFTVLKTDVPNPLWNLAVSTTVVYFAQVASTLMGLAGCGGQGVYGTTSGALGKSGNGGQIIIYEFS